MIAPAMPSLPLPPWNSQKYGNVPAFANVCLNVAPPSIGPLVNEPSSAVTVCLRWPLCVHTTVAPSGTVILFGVNLLSSMSTLIVCGAGAGAVVDVLNTDAGVLAGDLDMPGVQLDRIGRVGRLGGQLRVIDHPLDVAILLAIRQQPEAVARVLDLAVAVDVVRIGSLDDIGD